VKKPNSSIDSSSPHKIGVWLYILRWFWFWIVIFFAIEGM
jgi:hypothetical protein